MTMPPTVRIFFAIEIPEVLKQHLNQYLTSLKKACKTHGIRWTKPSNLHITLQFLAHVETQDLDKLIQSVKGKLAQNHSYPMIHFAELQFFPSAFRPRVIVLDVVPAGELTTLSRLIGEGIQATGYPIEHKTYRPHLTLGRIKMPRDINLEFLSSVEIPDFGEIRSEAVTLYRSDPCVDGSQYTVIDRLSLPPGIPRAAESF